VRHCEAGVTKKDHPLGQSIDSKVFLPGTPSTNELGPNVPCVLVLNKCDLGPNSRTNEEMDAFCREHRFAGWMTASATCLLVCILGVNY